MPQDIPVFDPADDRTHASGYDPSFQESALFVWNDLETGIGGFWRLGQEANAGLLNSCFGMFTTDGLRFRSNVSGAPMAPGDRGEAHMGWGEALRVDLERLAIAAAFPECEATLRFEDFFPRYETSALLERPRPGGFGHHFEVAGRMTGQVRLGDREIAVNALGYRDRSWGPRQWGGLRSTRWWPCVFGPDLCAFSTASVHESGKHGIYGYVIRDGVPMAMRDCDETVTLDYDGLGPRAGMVRFRLDTGETGEIVHQRHDGVVLNVRGYTAVESIGSARWGDRIGMSNLEVSTNACGGAQSPVLVLNANAGTGLSRR